MIRSVLRPDGLLQYRLLSTERHHRRRRRLRCASILVFCLLFGCLSVAAAVILPIALSTSLVALPAKLAKGKGLQGTRYFAILPVREAKSNEFRILSEARAANSTRASPIVDWALENKHSLLVIAGGVMGLLLIGLLVRRRCRYRTDDDRAWDMQGALLSEQDDE